MMNIKGAPVFFWSLSASAADFVASPYLFRQSRPFCQIKRERCFAQAFIDIVVNLFSPIPRNFALWGAKASTNSRAGKAAKLAFWNRLFLGHSAALGRAVFCFRSPALGRKRLSAKCAYLPWGLFFGFPITFSGAKLCSVLPNFGRCTGGLLENFPAIAAFLREYAHKCTSYLSIPQMGNN
jgi:hypothetical protein